MVSCDDYSEFVSYKLCKITLVEKFDNISQILNFHKENDVLTAIVTQI